jgi:SulP family sulfate permease
MVTLVEEHGLQYLLAATVLAGLLQIGAGLLKIGHLMRFVSRSVITGFVNALAILIFMAQLPELIRRDLPLTYADGRRGARDYLPVSAADAQRAVAAGLTFWC